MTALFTGDGPQYRPSIIVWLELPNHQIIAGNAVRPGEEADALVSALETALREPSVGPRRRPDVLRIADTDLGARLRETFDLPVVVAPTPEQRFDIGSIRAELGL